MREHGASYLRRIPIRTIENKLTSLISENYGIWADETFLQYFDSNYFEFISEKAMLEFAAVIEESDLFNPTDILAAFPIQKIKVITDFNSDNFSVIQPKSLANVKQPVDISRFVENTDKFPPPEVIKSRLYEFQSWLCVRAPNLESAKKKRSAILGAMSLKYMSRLRYQFNIVQHVGGYCLFGESLAFSVGEAHTPPVMQDIIVTSKDKPFLSKLNDLFESDSRNDFKKIRALEYFYRAWFLDESERFPFLFMSLESLYGDGQNATQSIVDGLKNAVDVEVSDKRIKLLAGLRGSIVHGGAPEIYDSKKYAEYYKKYKVCPAKDLSILVATCINRRVFDNLITEQPDEHQALIDRAIDAGKISEFFNNDIIDGTFTE
jgi:hypothetical protein